MDEIKRIYICKTCWKLYYDLIDLEVCDRCRISICSNCAIKINNNVICKYCEKEV